MRRYLYALAGAFLFLASGIAADAQVNPVYRQNSTTGNATQQQQITVPNGYGITVQSGASLVCQAGSTCTGASGTPTGAAGGDLTGTYPNPTIVPSVTLTTPNLGVASSVSLNATSQVAAGSTSWLGIGSRTRLYADSNGLLRLNSPTTGNGASIDFAAGNIFKFRNDTNTADVTVTAATQAPGDNSTNVATTAFVTAAVSAPNISRITASLGADVTMPVTGTVYTGPQIAQGTSGTWYVSGTVTIYNPTGGDNLDVLLWDGTTFIDSAATATVSVGAGYRSVIALSGIITNPAGNLRISVRATSRGDNVIAFNRSGYTKDSTISAIRLQ